MRPIAVWLLLAATLLGQDGRGFFAEEECRKQAPPLRSYDVHHYRIELSVDLATKSIAGTVQVRFTPLHPAFQEIALHCVHLRVKRVQDALGRELAHRQDGDRLVATLLAPLDPRQESHVSVTYEGSPRLGMYWIVPDAAYPERGAHVYTQGEPEETRHWLPCWDYPNDRATSEMIVTVGPGLTAVSNGRLVEVREEADGRRTFHWAVGVPHVAYLTSLVVGEFDEFALDSDDVRLTVYAPKGMADRAAIDRSFAKTRDMLAFFQERTGVPFPWEKYAQILVEEFKWAGMENVSATTLTATMLMDETAALESRSDWLVAHELAHQWWGNLITCRDWSHIWLNEGFATYFEAVFAQHDLGEAEFLWKMNEALESATREDSDQYRRPIVCSTYADPEDLFDNTTYQKGAWVLHMLRGMLGEEAFWKGIRHYAAKHREGLVGTEDLAAAFAEATGQDLGWFWDQWVYKAGFPDFSVTWSWDDANQAVRLRVRQTQMPNDSTPVFRCPLEVALCSDQEWKTLKLECRDQDTTYVIPCATRPATVLFDVGHRIAKRLDFPKAKEEWIWTLAHVDDVVERHRAIRGLKDAFAQGDEGAIQALSKVISSDPFYKVRQAAVDVIAETKTAKAEELLLAMAKDVHPNVRHSVTNGIGQWNDEKAIAALREALSSDPSPRIRASALASLVKHRTKDAWEAAIAGLATQTRHDVVATEAVKGIADLGRPESAERVMNLARYGNSPWVREAAIRALARTARGNPEVTAYLVGVLRNDPFHSARRAAFDVLNEWGSPEARPVLETMMASEPDLRLRRAARAFWRRLRDGEPAKQAERKRAEAAEKEKAAIAREAEGKQKHIEAEQLRAEAERLRAEAELLAPSK